MINFYLGIQNPFWKQRMNSWFKNFFCLELAVSRNKTLEINLVRHFYWLFSVTVDGRWKGEDHAGPELELNLLGFQLSINLRDNRHWDYDQDCWETYE